MTPSVLWVATALFGLAILHTFSVKRFRSLAHKHPEGSFAENLFHLLGEVEVVFGLWAVVLFCTLIAMVGSHDAITYIEGRNYTEPFFVFVIMTVAATRPIVTLANRVIEGIARLLPLSEKLSFYCVALVIGPLLGSFITEPAAMTVTAMILLERFYRAETSRRFKYLTLGVLFVNVSIGGTLTNFAAPPILMVARAFGWSSMDVMMLFGWKSLIAVCINAGLATFVLRAELADLKAPAKTESGLMAMPFWLYGVHLLVLGGVVASAHHMAVFVMLFLVFLAIHKVTREYQEALKLVESLLVGCFLGGLVILGGLQDWWLQPLLEGMNSVALFLGATGLTAITDNAALTYLGSLVEGLSESSKYALVAGAVAGGGLTVIANAPNPAGFAILEESFGEEGISTFGLLGAALIPTLIAMSCLWFL